MSERRICRVLGQHRSTQRKMPRGVINDLEREGLVGFQSNPHHKRSPFVELTEGGRTLFSAAMALQGPWADRLAEGASVGDIQTTHEVVRHLLARLAQDREA